MVEGQPLGIGKEASEDEEPILTISVAIRSLREEDMVIMLKLVVTRTVRNCLLPSNMTNMTMTQSLWDKAPLWK